MYTLGVLGRKEGKVKMKKICEENKCTGCYTCYNICPNNAIIMNDFGIDGVKPIINVEKCINCYLCEKSCPINSHDFYNFNLPAKAFVYKSQKQNSERSSSGGAAFTLYSEFLNENGVVYGANNIENNEFSFVRITDQNNLYKLQGSKYVHCHIGKIFKLIKNDLVSKKKVLFIGTPCQVAGLNMFLRADYKNLYTVDLICHGVPSQKILFDSINKKQNYTSIADRISFRNNIEYVLNVFQNNKILFSDDLGKNGYMKEFMRGTIYRENCYSCSYARNERISDLTIGDFWGLSEDSKLFNKKNEGISVLLPITNKGYELIEILRRNGIIEKRPLSEALNGNAQLNHPTKKINEYYIIRKNISKGINKAYKKCRTKREIVRDIPYIHNIYVKIKYRKGKG